MPRSEYPAWTPCKTCGKFNGCKGKKTSVASCDKHRAATIEEMNAVEEVPVSIRIVMK
jgi:hypothetical protein